MNAITLLLVRLLSGLYGAVPAQKAYGMGARLGELLYPFFPGRRRLSSDNIRQAGITDDPEEADRIGRKAFGHLAGHICEALKIGEVVTPDNWREHMVYEGPQEVWQILAETPDRPVMILTGHHGTWEAAVPIISAFRPMIAVARRMNNGMVEQFLSKKHFRGNITIIGKEHGFTPAILRQWKTEKAAMTLVMDQHAGKKQGVRVDFLGRPASTHTSPARLYLASRAPMLVGSFIRESPFQYRMISAGDAFEYEPTGDHDRDIREILSGINDRLGRLIRRYPEQYLWAHRRWR